MEFGFWPESGLSALPTSFSNPKVVARVSGPFWYPANEHVSRLWQLSPHILSYSDDFPPLQQPKLGGTSSLFLGFVNAHEASAKKVAGSYYELFRLNVDRVVTALNHCHLKGGGDGQCFTPTQVSVEFLVYFLGTGSVWPKFFSIYCIWQM